MNKIQKSVLITDLDNTLFDWFDNWYTPFSTALDFFAQKINLEKEEILPEIKKIHIKHNTTEYENVFHSLDIFKAKFQNSENFYKLCDEAKNIRRELKLNSLKLFSNARNTIENLKKKNTLIVVFTETEAFSTARRINKLELDGVIDFIYSPESKNELKNKLSKTTHKFLSPINGKTSYKPCPETLLGIINEIGAQPKECVYIGDCYNKDISMAQNAKVVDVLAKYGGSYRFSDKYNLLRAVTYWSSEAVEEEKRMYENPTIVPSFTLNNSIEEIFDYFEFTEFSNRVKANV